MRQNTQLEANYILLEKRNIPAFIDHLNTPLYLLISHYPLPSPRGRHASHYKMSDSRRETKLEKKEIFPSKGVGLGRDRNFTPQKGFMNITVASRQGQGFILQASSCTLPRKPSPFTPIIHYSSCLPDIQTSFS